MTASRNPNRNRDHRLRIARSDAFRLCIQSLVASALAYGSMKLVDSPSLTWCVFSSLFTLQVNLDRSLKSGIGQIIGATLGTVAGLAALYFFPIAADALPRLGLATLVTCLTSTIFPTTNYSIFVAAALALEPSAGIAGALSRALAVVLGSAIAIVMSLTVWPKLARSHAFDIMGELLDDCRTLLATLPILNPVKNRSNVDALHERFLRHLVDARATSGETRLQARFQSGPPLHVALTAFEALWHGLVLLDRVGQTHGGILSDEDRKALIKCVDAASDNACAYLEQLAAYMRNRAPLPSAQRCLRPLHDAATAVRSHFAAAVATRGQCPEQMQALCTLSFALDQIESNLNDIGELLEPRSGR